MSFKSRIIIALCLLIFSFLNLVKPALAIGGPFWYFKDTYVPAVYDDPNINLQKHVRETIMIIPMAMVDIGLTWIFPHGAKIVRDCVDVFKLTGNPFDNLGSLGACGADWLEMPSLADKGGAPTIASTKPRPILATLFPATTSSLQYTFSNIILTKTASAQGYGFTSLQGSVIADLWRAVRNLTYVLSALALVIMGLMIMFRVKLSPQVVITIEQAIPKFAVTLLLITFSFAIAGFCIDLVYLFGYLVALLVQSIGVQTPNGLLTWINGISGTSMLDFSKAGTIFEAYFNGPRANVLFLSFSGVLALLFQFGNSMSAFNDMVPLVGLVLGLIFVVFVVVVLIFNLFKIFWTLIQVYAQLVINIILAPLVIFYGILPGPGGGMGTWLTGFLQNLIVFPIVSAMFLIANVMVVSVGSSGRGWVPPQISASANLGLLLAAVGLYLAIPHVQKFVQSFFANKPFDYGTAIGESTKTASGLGRAGTIGATTHLAETGGAGSKAVAAAIQAIVGGKCLSPNTIISTPAGDINVQDMRIGMKIWTVDLLGHKYATVVIRTSRVRVFKNHHVSRLLLSDGRKLLASSYHPLTSGFLKDLKEGEVYDNSEVVRSKIEPYPFTHTYDILPAGETGFYWANGILIGSTLKQKARVGNTKKNFPDTFSNLRSRLFQVV